jgi:hypothetical protein
MWRLEGSDGNVIAYLTAREGGSLDSYVGRTIAVYATREGTHGGHALMKVSHIAVP